MVKHERRRSAAQKEIHPFLPHFEALKKEHGSRFVI
jgi:hypothetical protein